MLRSLILHCRPDAVIAQPEEAGRLATRLSSYPPAISMTDYIGSDFEAQRRRLFGSLPHLDHMEPGEFDRIIIGATRYTKWLRFYDKQIGKGNGLSRFRRGIERILALWTAHCYFPADQLSAELYTAVDKSIDPKYNTQTAYHRVRLELVESLSRQFGIPIQFHFKEDTGKSRLATQDIYKLNLLRSCMRRVLTTSRTMARSPERPSSPICAVCTFRSTVSLQTTLPHFLLRRSMFPRCPSRSRCLQDDYQFAPRCLNNFDTESLQGEQRGFMNLLNGLYGTIRNPWPTTPRSGGT